MKIKKAFACLPNPCASFLLFLPFLWHVLPHQRRLIAPLPKLVWVVLQAAHLLCISATEQDQAARPSVFSLTHS